jgi:tripartite ATP-independent transporter DctP family solute receptor
LPFLVRGYHAALARGAEGPASRIALTRLPAALIIAAQTRNFTGAAGPKTKLWGGNMRSVNEIGRVFALGSTLLFAAGIGGASAQQQRKFTFGYDQPHSTGYGFAGDTFDAKLKELSGGKMSIDQFPGAQLGQEPVMLQKVRSGDIDFIITSTANASTVAPQAGVFSLHFIFRDEDHLAKTISDPGVVNAFKEMISESVQGARPLGLLTLGLRHLYGKKEVKSVDDIKGQKVRVQATKTEDTHFPAYGAQTVHMPFGEVYTSLQTGVVNFAENGINVYLSNKHYEVAPVLSLTEHEANNNMLWVSEKTWNSLSDQEKQWVQAAADEVSKKEPIWALKAEKDSAAKLKTMGVKVVEHVDKSGFAKAAQPVQDQLAKELGPHAVKLLDLVRNVK